MVRETSQACVVLIHSPACHSAMSGFSSRKRQGPWFCQAWYAIAKDPHNTVIRCVSKRLQLVTKTIRHRMQSLGHCHAHRSPCWRALLWAGAARGWCPSRRWPSWWATCRPAAFRPWPRDESCPSRVASGWKRCPCWSGRLGTPDAARMSGTQKVRTKLVSFDLHVGFS